MDLEEKYEQLLLEIFEAENQRILKSELSEKEKSKREDLEFLIHADLVEYDKGDAAFYLTYEGYEEVEAMTKKLNEAGESMMNAEFEHSMRKERRSNIVRILIGIPLFVGVFFAMRGISVKPNTGEIKEVLNEELLNQIKEEIEMKTDSILNEK